jgi:hypothetical protein
MPPGAQTPQRRVSWWRNPLLSLGLATAALITAVSGVLVGGIPNSEDIQDLQECIPALVQVEDSRNIQSDAIRVIEGDFEPSEAAGLLVRLEVARASLEGVQAYNECLDPDTRSRVLASAALIRSAIMVLQAALGVLPSATPSPARTPS